MAASASVEAPEIRHSPASSSAGSASSATEDPLDLRDDEGWEDLEPEDQQQQVVCLFSDEIFPDLPSMLEHCKSQFDFEFVKTRNRLGLDFYGTIKLVNYIRASVKNGNLKPDLSSSTVLEDDKYLQPVLEDDALLFGLDDIPEETETNGAASKGKGKETGGDGAVARVAELEEELQRLQSQFAEYKILVKETLDERMDEKGDSKLSPSGKAQSTVTVDGKTNKPAQDDDSHYFTSYAYNDIHETMLKDTVRTDAYRDFIYENKDLFKDKVVLDVGCGTGILSMFCAKAGAKKVIAVDNSDIINKARENVFENGLLDVITCLRGKIEEVTLPVPQVDIIVSEWMGYCLLYEAMLDSVLWARDHYLSPAGLMVPSHLTLHLAPLSEPDYIASHISFWHNVYGFSMSSMQAHIHDDVLIRHLSPSALGGPSTIFAHLPLHSISVDDLSFTKPFALRLERDIDALDGWVIWFDTFFLRERDAVPVSKSPSTSLSTSTSTAPNASSTTITDVNASNDDATVRAETWSQCPRTTTTTTASTSKGNAFTTGPFGPETHWRQGVLLIDHGKRTPPPLKKDARIVGEVAYRKRADNARELEVEIVWGVEEEEGAVGHGHGDGAGKGKEDGKEKEMGKEKGRQLWFMR
ncbi:MAG: hypothetical protein M1819_007028 [Sarea resinae]|nr:MAG: hypothetical protein M1819_007028 [Sarea resinae]